MIYFSRQFFFRLLILMGLANLAAFAAAAVLGWGRAAVENGFIENIQMVLIIVSMVAAILASIWSSELLRVSMAGWAAINLLMIQREIDFRTFGEEHWLFTLHDATLRFAFWIPLAAVLIVWAARYWRLALRSVMAVRWHHVWPAVLIAFIMLGSELTEQALKARWLTNYEVAVFFEELFELNAYCVIAAAAVAIAVRVRRPGTPEAIAARNRLDPQG